MARLADRAITAIWERGLQKRPPLDAKFLWQVGAKGFSIIDETHGRSADDIADFRTRLDLVCESLCKEADLNALGHTIAYGQLTAAIRIRHDLGRLWQKYSGIERTPIAAPIIVVGQMRAGTTRMHRLLAADPAHSATMLFNSLNPVREGFDLRPIKTRAGLVLARQLNPWIDTLHPFGATRADEELPWLSHAMSPAALEAQYRIPSYVAFSEASDRSAIYREFARVLRSDAALMRNSALPRVLKCPQYAEDLAEMLAAFPDARIVVTRRDSEAVLASTLSLVSCQMACQSDTVQLPAIEREWRRKLALREERMRMALERFSGPVAEADFDALGNDWEAEIARVYRLLDLKLTREALTAMRTEQGRAKRSPHHGHATMQRGFAQA